MLDRFVHALTERAGERGMRVLVYAARSAGGGDRRASADLIDGGEVDAVVITGTFYGDPRTGWLHRARHPVRLVRASVGRSTTSTDPAHLWVDVDGAAGTRAGDRHALATAGDRVAFLGWPAGLGHGR